ncbi:MAG TPA: AraC family transcriptional regulator [Gemmatimonadaceae bacterium]|jgi:AraC-like DNA-binding protein|nr:AraC family transcriptional regulator [Gemmatimonadaceae bacterium]
MDPLSDVLRAVRLTGAYFYMVEATHPWSVLTVEAKKLVPRIHPAAEHLISYHILTSGACWGGVAGDQQTLMQAGDAIVFPQGDANLLSSRESRGATALTVSATPARHPNTVTIGGGVVAEKATFVCGFLGCDLRPFNPLLSALPRQIIARGGAGDWLAEFPKYALAESREPKPGSESMLTRMAELMFVEVLRRHVASLSEKHTGWLAGLGDAVVGPALRTLHETPERAWSLPDLAREVGTSRTVLVERFTEIVGLPPMQYLTQWRLQLASDQLARGSGKVASIGERVGYESEAAFSRAFKRATGSSPAAWRKVHQER